MACPEVEVTETGGAAGVSPVDCPEVELDELPEPVVVVLVPKEPEDFDPLLLVPDEPVLPVLDEPVLPVVFEPEPLELEEPESPELDGLLLLDGSLFDDAATGRR